MTSRRTTAAQKPWVHEMVIVHRVFRTELGMLPALVSGTAVGDRRRAGRLGDHYRFITQVLHTHHEYEDEHFWPVLLQRCPMDADLIHRMETQHEGLAAIMADLPQAWRAWEERADADSRARLAEGLTVLSTALDEHLQDEEVHLLPLMADHLSVQEWEAFGKHAGKHMDKIKGLFWLGLLFAGTTEDERARVWAGLPGWVRVYYRLAGPRAYRRGLARIRGEQR